MTHLRDRSLWVAVLGLLACACGPADAPPNILLILADDLGWNDVGYHGSEIPTPRLDALAEAGVRLEHFYAQPLCSATRASVLTGRYPMRQGLQMGVVRPWATHGLPLTERTLADELRERGYRTALVGKWHLGVRRKAQLPLQRGFDHHYGHYNGAIDYFSHRLYGGLDWHRDGEPIVEEGYATDLLAADASRWIGEGDRDRPFFLLLSFNAPHRPLQAPPEAEARVSQIADPTRRTYAAMVTALDDAVGRVVDGLEAAGRLDDTVIVFASDNGGAPGDGGDNRPLRGEKGTPYEGGTRVPAFVSWPSRLRSGASVSVPVHAVDLHPTLLALAGGDPESRADLDGRDAWPLVSGESDRPLHEALLLELTRNRGAVREGRWKLVAKRFGLPDESLELYDLVEDPGEQSDLAPERTEEVRRLRDRLGQWAHEAAPARWSSDQVPAGFRPPSMWTPAGLDAAAGQP